MKTVLFITMFISFHLFGCNSSERPPAETDNITIYVVSQGWHTGLIIPGNCIADSLWPSEYPYNQFKRLLIGWGDADYYQNRGFNLWYASKAAIWPTSSTLHIKAFEEIIKIESLVDDIVALQISEENYAKLCEFLRNQFEKDHQDQFIPQGPGFYSNSQFFASNKKYTAINNSNVWTAIALKEAGYDLTPYRYLTQKSLIKKVKKLSK